MRFARTNASLLSFPRVTACSRLRLPASSCTEHLTGSLLWAGASSAIPRNALRPSNSKLPAIPRTNLYGGVDPVNYPLSIRNLWNSGFNFLADVTVNRLRARSVLAISLVLLPAMAHTLHPLKAVMLTHVRYRRGDSLGHFLAWISLIPVFISFGGFVSHFLFRRELQGIFFAIGLFISQILNELVKTSVQQSRPETCAALEMCDTHGWPSSHSQYMFFFAVYFSLLAFRGVGTTSRADKALVALISWPLAVLTMYSRVYLGYHTVAQVYAGAGLGIILGLLWYWVVYALLIDYFPAIEECALGKLLYIKDTSHITDVLKFEYDNARAARKKSD